MTFTPEQLAERQRFIGGSESSAALGLNPFFSQVELYQSKIGAGEPIEATVPMLVGTALEPVVLEIFERKTGFKVISRQQVFVDPKCPWRRCTVDGICSSDLAIVEAKTSGDFRGWGENEDEVPQHYLFNAMHSLACIPEAPGVRFPVLVGGRTYRTYYVPRDEELIALVAAGEKAFMDLVASRTPPEPKSMDDVRSLYPKSLGTAITATQAVEEAAERIAKAKAQKKSIEKQIEDDMVIVTGFMKSASELRRLSLVGAQGTLLATWNSGERRTLDTDYIRSNYPTVAQQAERVSKTRTYLNKIKEQT
jgi:putative phage-type endonuclease